MWVSSNSQKFIENVKADDSCGYDIIYIDEHNDERYVEVKSSLDNNFKIKISKNEVEVGNKNPKNYDIHYVKLNEQQIPQNYWIIKNVINFEDNEDFLTILNFSLLLILMKSMQKLKKTMSNY